MYILVFDEKLNSLHFYLHMERDKNMQFTTQVVLIVYFKLAKVSNIMIPSYLIRFCSGLHNQNKIIV